MSNSPNFDSSYKSIPKIRVIVRKRPLSQKEQQKNDTDIIEIRNKNKVIVKELKQKVDLTKYIEEHPFIFDNAFDQNSTNEEIYISTIRPMIEAAFNKTKVTCFAYGQTGSGKTFTMMGSTNKIPGMYLLASYDIFSLLQNNLYNGFTIWISFYEIYCGKLYDLLNERNILTAREDGKQNIIIVGLTEKQVLNLNNLMSLIEYGLKVRTVGVTGANSDSSRSHGIIQINIKDNNNNIHGKISFIDLAGSERAADTINTNKQTKFDGAEINKSLLALKECIRALDQEKKHTPFRGSKLTLVLRDSFIGNCKTLMIANISPALSCSEHTLNTLRYADRVKELRGKNDIKIGDGNVNLNYNNCNNVNIGNCNYDDLANLMYMPRQHGNSIKYDIDGNLIKISARKTFRKGKKGLEKKSIQKNNGGHIGVFENNAFGNCGKGLNCNLFSNLPAIGGNNISNNNLNMGSNSIFSNLNMNFENNSNNNVNQQQSFNFNLLDNNSNNNNLNNLNNNNQINNNANNLNNNNQINNNFNNLNDNNQINNNSNNNNNNVLNNNLNNNNIPNNNFNIQNNPIELDNCNLQFGNNSLLTHNNPFTNPSNLKVGIPNVNMFPSNNFNFQYQNNQNPTINNSNNNLINNEQIQLNDKINIQSNLSSEILSHQSTLQENKENIQSNNNNNIIIQKQQSNICEYLKKNLTTENNSIKSLSNKKQGIDSFAFLNDYTSFNNHKKENSNEKEISDLRDKYEALVNSILTEEKNYIESHKLHIDEMVLDMKNEMNLINLVETKSNIDEYINNLLSIFNSQEEKIKNMKNRLLDFKQMLNEESELGAKINLLSKEDNNVFSDVNSFNNNINNNNNNYNEENLNNEDSELNAGN